MTLTSASPMAAAGSTRWSESLAAEYLAGLRALAAEMEAAMGAIARNQLPGLEESVGKQEALSARLVALAKRLGPDMTASKGSGLVQRAASKTSDSGLGQRIRAATDVLRDLNRRYAALLKYSGRSIDLLSTLCGSYTGQIYREPAKEARGTGSKHQTWYCEM